MQLHEFEFFASKRDLLGSCRGELEGVPVVEHFPATWCVGEGEVVQVFWRGAGQVDGALLCAGATGCVFFGEFSQCSGAPSAV